MKHDYAAALEKQIEEKTRLEFIRNGMSDNDIEYLILINKKIAICDANIHALKLAAVVTGEPTEGMSQIGWKEHQDRGNWVSPQNIIFKAMIAQAEKEIG